jgi:hypothetical protein
MPGPLPLVQADTLPICGYYLEVVNLAGPSQLAQSGEKQKESGFNLECACPHSPACWNESGAAIRKLIVLNERNLSQDTGG